MDRASDPISNVIGPLEHIGGFSSLFVRANSIYEAPVDQKLVQLARDRCLFWR